MSALIVIDATEGFTEQDSKVAGYAHEQGKASIVVINKWDAVEKDGKTMDEYRKKLENDFSFMSYAPYHLYFGAYRSAGGQTLRPDQLCLRAECPAHFHRYAQ